MPNNEWETPHYLFVDLDEEFDFTLDPCATKQNAKCKKYYTEKDNGLTQDWSNEIVFMNPPYDRSISQWIRKAWSESIRGSEVVCLIPSNTDTNYWHKYCSQAKEIRFIKGRLKFGNAKHSAMFASAIVIFDKKKKSAKTKYSY